MNRGGGGSSCRRNLCGRRAVPEALDTFPFLFPSPCCPDINPQTHTTQSRTRDARTGNTEITLGGFLEVQKDGLGLKHCPVTQHHSCPAMGFASWNIPHPHLTVLEEEFRHSWPQHSGDAPREGQSGTQMWCPGTPQLLSPECHCLPPSPLGP